MKKLQLNLDQLQIESFDTSPEVGSANEGTAYALRGESFKPEFCTLFCTGSPRCVSCDGFTCAETCSGTCSGSTCEGTCGSTCDGTCNEATCGSTCGGTCGLTCGCQSFRPTGCGTHCF